jgi:hypothetical protein
MTCDALNGAAGFTRELISNEETRNSLLQQQPAIAVDAVKGLITPEAVEADTADPHPE